ncbi:hypothetical protein D3C84_957010 [compost metagenome]
MALLHRAERAGLEPGQFALGLVGQARRIAELALEVFQALLAIGMAGEEGQGLLQRLLQGLLLGLRQLAPGQVVEVLLHGLAGRCLGGGLAAGEEAETQEGGGEVGAQYGHGRFGRLGKSCG